MRRRQDARTSPPSVWLPIMLAVAAFDPCNVAAQQSSLRMIAVEGRQVRVMTGGLEHLERGQHVVVLESGAGTPVENWRAIFADIAALAPVIAYDRSGIGRSPWDGRPPTPQRRAQQLRALLAELELPPSYVAGRALVGRTTHPHVRRAPPRRGGRCRPHHRGYFDVAGLVDPPPCDRMIMR
jgi:pimeloyl-ACP methyl ester carboxylesterase